jgi:preprotein translocase subunit YajC
MWTTFLLLAQDAGQNAPPDGGQSSGSPFGALLPFLLIIPLFWILMIRPARKQEAQRKAMLSALEKDDKVLTNGGIIGWVVSVSDDDVVVRIADNVKVKMVKSGIAQNLTKLEALSGSQQTASADKK